MANQPQRPEAEVAAPERGIDIGDPRPLSYEPSHVIQLLVAMQKELSAQGAKVERLIVDVNEVDKHVSDLKGSFAWAKGFGAAAVILIPVCAVIVWWFIGDKLNQMKAQLLLETPSISRSAPAPTPSPNAGKR
jgi:hypothetical protein